MLKLMEDVSSTRGFWQSIRNVGLYRDIAFLPPRHAHTDGQE